MADVGECGCVVRDEELASCYCVLEPLVQAVGRKHALQVLNVIAARDRVHFSEIQNQLGGLSSSTLAARLHDLEEVEVICRQTEGVDPPRSEYRLTRKGRVLRDSLRHLFPSS